MSELLRGVVAAVEEEGERLREEFHRPDGPRGRGGSAPIDAEIETRLCAKLQALVPCAFAGEETGTQSPKKPDYEKSIWMVDPHDGTYEFLQGRRGSAISVALLKDRIPVLGVVCSPLSPDRGWDTIAWAEGEVLTRNGKLVRNGAKPNIVWCTASSALRPDTFARAVLPARYVAMPSIAYRLARVAAGDGIATLSTHSVNEYDFAAGMALLRACDGVLLDAEGKEISLEGNPERRVSGLFAGSREAASHLCAFPWKTLDAEPRKPRRVSLGFPRKRDDARLARAAGCLLGQVIGDSLGSRVEFMSSAEVAREFPGGVRELGDGGQFHTFAGQPTDDSEMALALCRSLIKNKSFRKEEVLASYREWLQTRPVDVGATTERGLLGLHTSESESNGSLMRVSPIGVWAAGDPARAAAAAREDSLLTHPNPVCVSACAGYAAAIATGVAGGDRHAMLRSALEHASGKAREAIEAGASGKLPADFQKQMGWVLIALQNAFHKLMHAESFEEALVQTVACGGDSDTNAAIAGALLGALHGREAIPARWVLPVLSCRPIAEAGALRPRPMDYWPDDLLELAEALLNSVSDT